MILPLTAATLANSGGKAVNLGRLVRAGFPVPDGFVVTAGTYQEAVGDLDINGLLANGGASRVREAVEARPVPSDLIAALEDHLAAWGDYTAVAVRSSATAEDLPEASFAGQQDTFLGVRGAAAIVDSVRRCWGSLWTERAVSYRQRNNIDHTNVTIAVIIQRLIDAETAGVLFTANPITGAAETLINASWGLGESVVSGLVTPDEYHVTKGKIKVKVGLKSSRLDRQGEDLVRTDLTDLAKTRCLSDKQVTELTRLGQRVHHAFRQPMDIEWAFDQERLWLLQARPITTIRPSDATASHETRSDHSAEPAEAGQARSVEDRPSRLSRLFYQDLVEHYPGPFPLDLFAITRVHQQLQFGMEQIGVSSTPIAELIHMQTDGTITVDYPKVRLGTKLLRLLHYPSPDPRTWPETEWAFRRQLSRISVPRADADPALVLNALDQILNLVDDITRARFLDYLGPAMLRSVRLSALLKLAGRPDLTPYDFLGELDYVTAVVDKELHRIAQMPPGDPETEDAICSFLATYGARTSKMYLPFSQRSWREDPKALRQTLAALRRQSGTSRLNIRHAELVASVRRNLPAFTRRYFERLVDQWRAGHIAREASLYLIEEAYVLARTFMDILASRLTAYGYLHQADEVKLLSFTELRLAFDGELTATQVRERVSERQRNRPRAAATWWRQSISHTRDGATVSGVPGSPGLATGTARVITSTDDFARLQPNDILVCQYTDPTWTPLFGLAAAVVADTGGQLSHAAIVAREYGIPAVLGTGEATSRIVDGQTITVDGTQGTVSTS